MTVCVGIGFFLLNSVLYNLQGQAIGYTPFFVTDAALSTTPSDAGDIDTFTIGYRYMPIMTSRAGFAWHNEFNIFHQNGTSPLTGTNVNTSELLMGFDFDF